MKKELGEIVNEEDTTTFLKLDELFSLEKDFILDNQSGINELYEREKEMMKENLKMMIQKK